MNEDKSKVHKVYERVNDYGSNIKDISKVILECEYVCGYDG